MGTAGLAADCHLDCQMQTDQEREDSSKYQLRAGSQWVPVERKPQGCGAWCGARCFWQGKICYKSPHNHLFSSQPLTPVHHTVWSSFSASKFSDKTSPHRPHACPGLLQVERCRHPSLLRALQHELSADGLLTPAVFQLMK